MAIISPAHLSLLGVLFVICSLTSYGLWHFRKERSIELRLVPAMLHCTWLVVVVVLIDVLRITFYEEQYEGRFCWAFRLRFVFEHQNVLTLFYSAYRVLFFMELAAHLAKTRDSQNRANLLAGRGGWYVRNRHWIEWKYAQYFFLVSGLAVLAIVLILAIFDNGCGNLNAFRLLGPALNAFYLSGFIYLIYRLSKWGRDGFHIKMDLFRMCIVLIIFKAVAYGLIIRLGEGFWVAYTETLLLWVAALSVVLFFAILPLIRVIISRETFTEPTTLEELVRRPSGYESFLEFLNSEFASESLHFWNNVNLYRARAPNMPDTKARVDYANELVETFIRPSAVLEVNLTSAIKNKIYETIAACQKDCEEGKEHPELSTMFDAAQAEMMKVMSRDNFRRYLKSPQYEAWKEEHSTTKKTERGGESSSRSNSTHSTQNQSHTQPSDDSMSSKRGNVRATRVVVTRVEVASPSANGFERLHTPRSSLPHSSAEPPSSTEPPSPSVPLDSPKEQVNIDVSSQSDNELP